MCSYGGRIVPRPTDKSLCYLGGETRIVVVERHSLADLSTKLSRSLLGDSSFSLKYQFPNEELDSLISVTTNENLDNMIEEYDHIIQSSADAVGPGGGGGNIGLSRSNRLRLFLFPSKPESTPSSIGSLLDDSKSESWFVDALNSAMGISIDGLSSGLSADSTTVNCLLGLEDNSSTHSRGISGGVPGVAATSKPEQLILTCSDSFGKLARQGRTSIPFRTPRCSMRHLPLDPPRPPPHSPALVGRHGPGPCGPCQAGTTGRAVPSSPWPCQAWFAGQIFQARHRPF